MTLKYTTTLQLAETLGILSKIPSWDIGNDSPGNEAVGTGDNIETQFYLDHKNILAGAYTLYANDVAMTEITHYTLNLETGEITLTTAGVTMLDVNALTAKYNYINNGMNDSYLEEVLERSEQEVDNSCNVIFTDTSGDNPTYTLETEIQASDGVFQDRIIVNRKPLIDIATTLNVALDDSQNTVNLLAGTGANYPTTGLIIVGSEVMSYTGITTDQLTGVTRGAMDTTATAHDDGDDVHSTILFSSDTIEGSSVSWTIQPWDINMDANEFGLLYSFSGSSPGFLSKIGVANRIKIIYYYGYDSVPADITRLTIIYSKRQLVQDNISKAMIAGRNEFRPEMFSADQEEMTRILNAYRILPMGNT